MVGHYIIQALSITSHNCTKDSSSSSVQRGTLAGSNLQLQTLATREMVYSSRFILKCSVQIKLLRYNPSCRPPPCVLR
jgi:hypothetical protein